MENGLLIDMHDPVVQFCVSFITMNVAEVRLERVIGSWNSHSIDGVYHVFLTDLTYLTEQIFNRSNRFVVWLRIAFFKMTLAVLYTT